MDQTVASSLRLSKLPTPSVRVRKASQSQEKENLLDGSYLVTGIQAILNRNKRPSLDCDELPEEKKIRFEQLDTKPLNMDIPSVGLKNAIKKRARKSISKAVEIRNKKGSKAAIVKPTQRPMQTQRKPLSSGCNYSKPPNNRFQAHSAKKPSVVSTPVTAVKSNRSAATSVKPSTKRKPWDLKGQLEDVRSQLASQEEIFRRLEALETEKKQVKVENATLSCEIKNTTGEISSLQENLQRERTENQAKDKAIRTLNLDLEESRRQYNKESKERYELELEVRTMRKEKLELKELKDKNSKEIQQLKENVESLEKTLRNHLDTIAKQEEDLRSFENDRRTLLNEVQELKGNIRVFCRVRPALGNEEQPDHIDYVGQANKSINITNDHNKESEYTFDQVFGPQSSQEQVFQELSQLVQSALDGFNVCVFAYGQTGSGKTYTMEGPDDPTDEQLGIIPRAMREIFSRCQELEKYGWKYNLFVEHVEIYREKLQDLLSKKNSTDKLEIRTTNKAGESKVWVSNLTSHTVKKYGDVSSLLELSKGKRATAATLANDRSSRSHSVFMLQIKATNDETGQNTESTLNLVDLAGSERVSETGSSGTRLKEAQKINSSLSSLSSVISALAKKESHIPYRNSKLTFLLMNSLGGNSKTLMLVNINPVKTAVSETINTLRFATTVNNCNIGTAQKIVKF